MQAEYDAKNPAALARLLKNGVKLRIFSKEIMDACYKAAQEVMNEEAAKNAKFKTIYEPWKALPPGAEHVGLGGRDLHLADDLQDLHLRSTLKASDRRGKPAKPGQAHRGRIIGGRQAGGAHAHFPRTLFGLCLLHEQAGQAGDDTDCQYTAFHLDFPSSFVVGMKGSLLTHNKKMIDVSQKNQDARNT
jgi:hypothetical protein